MRRERLIIEIKLMTINDCNRAYSLWSRTPGLTIYRKDDSPKGIERFLQRNPTTSFIALEGDKTIGTILAGHDGRRGYIYNACVDSAFRVGGVGRLLLERALKALKAEGIYTVRLTTEEENVAGNAFWISTGWKLRSDLTSYEYILDTDNKEMRVRQADE